MSGTECSKRRDPVTQSSSLEWAGRTLLMSAGLDLGEKGIERTPERFAKAMTHLTSGYSQALDEVIGQGVFEAEGRGLVSVLSIEYYSLCEHHLLPFWGSVSVGYYPDQKIIGLSKVARIVEHFSRRFQVQERLTREIAEALYESIAPRAVAVKAQGRHLCMMMRGVEKQSSETITEFAIGVETIREDELTRLWSSLD